MTIRGKNATISAKKNSASIHGSMAFASRSIGVTITVITAPSMSMPRNTMSTTTRKMNTVLLST